MKKEFKLNPILYTTGYLVAWLCDPSDGIRLMDALVVGGCVIVLILIAGRFAGFAG